LVREGRERRLASAYVLRPLGLPSSQFTEGRVKDLSRRERSKASRESKSIFELAKYIEVLRFIYSKVWRSSGVPELRVSVILTSVK
jgi:hypothetical protein